MPPLHPARSPRADSSSHRRRPQITAADTIERLEVDDVCPICRDSCLGCLDWLTCGTCDTPYHIACVRQWVASGAHRYDCAVCRSGVIRADEGPGSEGSDGGGDISVVFRDAAIDST